MARKDRREVSLVMEQISLDKAKESNARLEIIGWDDFEATLKKRGLGVFESGGWMKIMKKGK
jgi:hypothetical protein